MQALPIMLTPVLRRAAILFVPAFVAAVLSASARAQPPAAGADEARSQAQNQAQRSLLADAQARLAFNLIDKVAAGAGRQVTISPASLASALGLVSIGADPKMNEAIARTLGFAPDKAEAGLKALDAVRGKLADGGDTFAFAGKIVFAPSNPPGKDMLARLKDFHVPYEIADLSTAEGAKQIDDWVKDVTKDAIPELLGGPVPKAAFAALNALHFKGRWRHPFDPKRTAAAAFTGVDGKSAEVKMMRLGKGTRAFRREKIGECNFIAIDLPFADDHFSLVVATTGEGAKPAAAKDFAPVAGWLSGAGFAPHSGDLALPRFAASGRQDLMRALDSLGLDKARRSATALSGFGRDVELSEVIQRAMIEVDEEGAEAAAATAVIGTRMIEADDSIHMVVDKPFIYALRDRTTGLILIAGYVGAPPKEKTS